MGFICGSLEAAHGGSNHSLDIEFKIGTILNWVHLPEPAIVRPPADTTEPDIGVVMAKVCVNNLFISLDGFAAGEFVTFDQPIGDAQALFSYFDGRVIEGVHQINDAVTADRALFAMWGQGIGAEIMGRKKFGPQSGPWPSDGWRGWWGDEPPFKTPCFVLTHHPRTPMNFDNGTSFHFIDAAPEAALEMATVAANGRNIRIGGGPSTVKQFLAAGLIDFMHLVIVPVTLGRGVSLWDGLEGLEKDFTVESVTTASGLTHQLWNRRVESSSA